MPNRPPKPDRLKDRKRPVWNKEPDVRQRVTAKAVGEVAAKRPANSHEKRIAGHRKKLLPGQPYVTSKLTTALTERLCVEIRKGLPYRTCARLVHLSERSFESWMARASAEIEHGIQSEYVNFYHQVQAANAEAHRTIQALVVGI
jgi:hypothetical protein